MKLLTQVDFKQVLACYEMLVNNLLQPYKSRVTADLLAGYDVLIVEHVSQVELFWEGRDIYLPSTPRFDLLSLSIDRTYFKFFLKKIYGQLLLESGFVEHTIEDKELGPNLSRWHVCSRWCKQ